MPSHSKSYIIVPHRWTSFIEFPNFVTRDCACRMTPMTSVLLPIWGKSISPPSSATRGQNINNNLWLYRLGQRRMWKMIRGENVKACVPDRDNYQYHATPPTSQPGLLWWKALCGIVQRGAICLQIFRSRTHDGNVSVMKMAETHTCAENTCAGN